MLRQAGGAYAEAVADGAVTDRTEYLEALGFYQAVGAELEALSGAGDANLAEVVAMMQASLEDAAPAFGGLSGEGIATPDASLIYGAAARMELAALRLR
ncbi:hypothetical protein [Tropicimonas sp. IMCC6043]|uniref:hypothetical protein n=1 Tax=Tropicimonas sp. IMCC6043 TaxID=2510645 RepID=UPI00101C4919|nr:hypothetical protein [Tropicimonas sp. IMCC6043]RYH11320.1 hypothetical protein EU800_05515 [Tropicimonas sp. IMCC6043]